MVSKVQTSKIGFYNRNAERGWSQFATAILYFMNL